MISKMWFIIDFKINDFDTWMKLNNAIVRHMTILLDEKPKVHVEEEKKKAELLAMSMDEENVQTRLAQQIEKRIKKEENMAKAMGVTGGVLKGVKGTLDAMGFGGLANVLNLEEANKAMEETAKELGISDEKAASFGDKLKIATAGAAAMGAGLMTALTDPATIMVGLTKGLMDAFKHIDADTSSIAKNMNMSYNYIYLESIFI